MRSLDKIETDGFRLTDRGRGLNDLALASLKTSLEAYFGTYQHERYRISSATDESPSDREMADFNLSSDYCIACAETIVHMQHFVELACKHHLRAVHELMVDEAAERPVVLLKLLKGEVLTAEEAEAKKSIEFSTTIERVCTLLKEGRLDASLDFIRQDKPILNTLNKLRNRMWHRGTFILRYAALDHLMGGHVLPFAQKLLSVAPHTGTEHLWKYSSLKCGIDPLQEIISEFRAAKPDLGKVAFLKELARAAYRNPLVDESHQFDKMVNKHHVVRAHRLAKAETTNVNRVSSCPVCGTDSLVIYDDVNVEGEDWEEGTYEQAWRYTWQATCFCCTFEIDYHLKNPSDYGLTLIEDYWKAESI